MIDRRRLMGNAGKLVATGAIGLAAPAGVAVAGRGDMTYPPGEWTSYGEVRRAGGVLHYAEIGPDDTGQPPVVLLHKLGGWLSDWRQVAAELGKTRKVIAFDLPGHGGSRWDGQAPFIQTLAETAAFLLGAFDEMELDKVDLVGTSLGGCAAVLFAAFYPERINSLAIVSSALGGRKSMEVIRASIDATQGGMFDADGLPTPIRDEQLVTTFGTVNPGPINVEGNASRRAAGRWIQPSERGVGITDIAGTLSRISAPTLLLYGDKDPTYIRFRESAEASLANSTTEFVPDAGAFVMQDNPPATASILKTWLERNA